MTVRLCLREARAFIAPTFVSGSRCLYGIVLAGTAQSTIQFFVVRLPLTLNLRYFSFPIDLVFASSSLSIHQFWLFGSSPCEDWFFPGLSSSSAEFRRLLWFQWKEVVPRLDPCSLIRAIVKELNSNVALLKEYVMPFALFIAVQDVYTIVGSVD
ncbi:hypothetical protein F2Q70_00004709 [Brassica cretica]|uniref:Uncharacterized protein n=1 Tax=Brassica cretica TaxID=69181 RepID=A0A8S9IYX8_BRACR|nr:hypothetical protein F2Q70_00004709 [Brassica cretica]